MKFEMAHKIPSGINRFITVFSRLYIVIPIVIIAFGVFFAYVVPPLWGIDEGAHFQRAYQISQGGFMSVKNGDNFGGYLSTSVDQLIKKVGHDLFINKPVSVFDRTDEKSNDQYEYITKERPSKQVTFMSFNGSAAYPPVAYAAPAVGIFIADRLGFSLGGMIITARMFGLVMFAILIAFAIRVLDGYKLQWLVVVMALIPKVVFQASIVSADGLVNAVSVLIFALFLKAVIARKLSKTELVAFVISVILLPLLKFNYGILSATILLIPQSVFSQYINNKKIIKLFQWVAFGVAGLITLGWLYMVRHVGEAIGGLHRLGAFTISPIEQVKHIYHQPLGVLGSFFNTILRGESDYLNSAISMLGWNYVQIPLVVVVVVVLSVFIATFYAKDELVGVKKMVFAGATLSLISLISIFGILYITFSPVGAGIIDGVQGRYFVPLAPFLLAAIAIIVPIKIKATHRNIAIFLSVTTISSLLISATYYLLATH